METMKLLEKQHQFMQEIEKRIGQIGAKSKRIQATNEKLRQSNSKYKELLQHTKESSDETIRNLNLDLVKLSKIVQRFDTVNEENIRLKLRVDELQMGNLQATTEAIKLRDLHQELEAERIARLKVQQMFDREQEQFRRVLGLKNAEINQLVSDCKQRESEISSLKEHSMNSEYEINMKEREKLQAALDESFKLKLELNDALDRLKRSELFTKELEAGNSKLQRELNELHNHMGEKQQMIDALQTICKRLELNNSQASAAVNDNFAAVRSTDSLNGQKAKLDEPVKYGSADNIEAEVTPRKRLPSLDIMRKSVGQRNSEKADSGESDLRSSRSSVVRAISPEFKQFLNSKGDSNRAQSPSNPFFPSRSRKSSAAPPISRIPEEDPSFLVKEGLESEKALANLDAQIASLEKMFE